METSQFEGVELLYEGAGRAQAAQVSDIAGLDGVKMHQRRRRTEGEGYG